LLEHCHLVGDEYNTQSLRTFIDELAFTLPHARFLFYLLGLVKATQEIQDLLLSGHVVADRYLSSTLAHHWAIDPNLKKADLSWLSILKPDLEFLLVIHDRKEHERRISERTGVRSDFLLESDRDYLFQVQEQFIELNLIQVDVSHRSVEIIVDELVKQVKSNGTQRFL
jgi:thymidylate kinase